MPSHDLDDRYRFLFIYIGIGCDLADSGSDIFRGTSEAGSMIGVYKIIVDGFGLSNYADRTSDVFGIA